MKWRLLLDGCGAASGQGGGCQVNYCTGRTGCLTASDGPSAQVSSPAAASPQKRSDSRGDTSIVQGRPSSVSGLGVEAVR